jgi:hypothetical protein
VAKSPYLGFEHERRDELKSRSAEEVLRIKGKAMLLFGDVSGGIDLEALADPPKTVKR